MPKIPKMDLDHLPTDHKPQFLANLQKGTGVFFDGKQSLDMKSGDCLPHCFDEKLMFMADHVFWHAMVRLGSAC